ncbi:hypothetical protein DOTSEDRAFT_87353 [Dothistroma septosporum NZE10]|uniref:HORMA domain-containing protein n=1 Tax=Dothistroma septosporum (strain NZE10 / CBS 128990) TaxID=675120 RepID=N1PR51_DOTSN|nr:hypothetical protein DOTSEDRAFT_87353 [Dothistroma septosporum NZE10]
MQKTKTKPKNQLVTTRTAFTQQQSLEIVQTLLHGATSFADHSRRLLPKIAFHEQVIEHGNRMVYADYANGKLNNKKSTKVHMAIQAMQRGKSKRTDMFLTWLENGAFTALKDGHLRAVQLNIHAQPDSRDKVLETYTFTVKYDSGGAFEKKIAGVQMNGQKSVARTVEATNIGLQSLLRELIACSNALPALPAGHLLNCHLRFTGQGSDAHASNIMLMAFSTTLRISHLRQPDLHPLVPGSPIPSQLEYGNIGSRMEEALGDGDTVDEGDQDAAETSKGNEVTPSTVVDETVGPDRQPTRIFDESLDTQSSVVPRMRSALRDMLQPERLTQGDTQTQVPLRPQRITTTPAFTAGPSTDFAEKSTGTSVSSDSKLVLLPEVAARLESEKPKLHKKAMQLAGPREMSDKNDRVIFCQCGFDGKDDNMIHCDFCDTWQHLYCYGFSGSQDSRTPGYHVCYQCLLGGRDVVALCEVKELALKRRVMSYALKNGLRKKTDMAKSLGIPIKDAKRLQRQFQDEGFLQEASNSHKPGFAKTGQPHFLVTRNAPTYQTMIQRLFDPLVVIAKYYANVDTMPTPNTIAQQLDAMRSSSMPLAATPASRLRGQDTPTTTSGLDPRASATPYITPSRRTGPILKRQRDEEDIFSVPAKRAATQTSLHGRLKSAQMKVEHSQYMLKANGSSPGSVGQ